MFGAAAKDPEPTDEPKDPTESQVFWKRFKDARAAGLDEDDSAAYASSDTDTSTLRYLVESGCEPALIARIVT